MYTQPETAFTEIDRKFLFSSRLTALLEQSAARHDHLCPRQVLGVRMGLAGLAAIGLPSPMPPKAAVVIIETDGCFADGIEVASGATIGHRTLRVKDFGKAAATFANVRTGEAVRLAPQAGVRERVLCYVPETMQTYEAQLNGYQVMPEAELFRFQPVLLTPSLDVILSRPGLRVTCERCGEEIINAREVWLEGEILCADCAGERYYRLSRTP
ncbi:MAG: FmdE family protein [Anaerolineales bacterium]